MSCDNNQDLFPLFHHCMEKYWKGHPEIIYSTESVVNPYYKTICRNYPLNEWTKRVRDTIIDLPCKHILLLVDDIFIRDYVNGEMISELCDYIYGDIASLNFEFSFDPNDRIFAMDRFGHYICERNPKGKFKVSCMVQMWRKMAMVDLFNCSKDPWAFEKANNGKNYRFLISKDGDLLNWGKKRNDWRFSIVKGKWTKECKEFFDKEGIEIDYSKRGFIDD